MNNHTEEQIKDELAKVNQRIDRLAKGGTGRKGSKRNFTRLPLLRHFVARRNALEAKLEKYNVFPKE